MAKSKLKWMTVSSGHYKLDQNEITFQENYEALKEMLRKTGKAFISEYSVGSYLHVVVQHPSDFLSTKPISTPRA